MPVPQRSFAVLFPSLAAELDDQRNDGVDPWLLAPRSNRRLWWRCVAGHRWETSPDKRVTGTGCPYCAHTRATPSTSLAASRPDLAAQWHPTRNASLTPADVLPNSGVRTWWRCARGHDWQARIAARTRGSGCPACADNTRRGEPVLTIRPDLGLEWDSGRSGPLDATVMAGSHRRVWWRCARGHSWEAPIQRRVKQLSGCPFCAGRRVAPENSLAALLPSLANDWHVERNGSLTPAQVLPGSGRRVWWHCPSGHEWQAAVGSRARGTGCPNCAKRPLARGPVATEPTATPVARSNR